MAGTIAAIDNDRDVVGAAAGATVCSVRVLNNQGSGTFEWVISGVDFVAANADPGDVANMSLGAESSDTTMLARATRVARGEPGVPAWPRDLTSKHHMHYAVMHEDDPDPGAGRGGRDRTAPPRW